MLRLVTCENAAMHPKLNWTVLHPFTENWIYNNFNEGRSGMIDFGALEM